MIQATVTRRPTARLRSLDHALASDVAAAARERLTLSPYPAVRQIECQFRQGVLTLTGALPTFHMKQVAQECVRDLEHVDHVKNAITVR